MLYLLHTHWLWFFGAGALGIIVGWLTYLRDAARWTDRPVHIAVALVLLGAVVAIAKVVPGRYGYWLELGVIFAILYAIGCFVGWALRDLADYMPAAAKPGAAAAAATAGSYLFRDAHAGLGTGSPYMRSSEAGGAAPRERLNLGPGALTQAPASGGYTFPKTLPFADAPSSRAAEAAPGVRRHWSWPRPAGSAPYVTPEFTGTKGGYVFPAVAAAPGAEGGPMRAGTTRAGLLRHWTWRGAAAADAPAVQTATAAPAATAGAGSARPPAGTPAPATGGYVFPAAGVAAPPAASRDGQTRGGHFRHWTWRGTGAAGAAPSAGAASGAASAALSEGMPATGPAAVVAPAATPSTAASSVPASDGAPAAAPASSGLASSAASSDGAARAPATPIESAAAASPSSAGPGAAATAAPPEGTAAAEEGAKDVAASATGAGQTTSPTSAAVPVPAAAGDTAAGPAAVSATTGSSPAAAGASGAPSGSSDAGSAPAATASSGIGTPGGAPVRDDGGDASTGSGVPAAAAPEADAKGGEQTGAIPPEAPQVPPAGGVLASSDAMGPSAEAKVPAAEVPASPGAPSASPVATAPPALAPADVDPVAAGLPAAPPVAPGEPPIIAAVPGEEKHPGERPVGLMAARDNRADDLKRIRGIGPQNEGRLHGLGIWHFDQIAAWTPDNVRWVGSYLAFPGRIDREKWLEQAKVLAEGGDTAFSQRVRAGKVATSHDDGSQGQLNIDTGVGSRPRKPPR